MTNPAGSHLSRLDLCGTWELVQYDDTCTLEEYLSGSAVWVRGIRANIPQSIQTTYFENGLIPNPMHEKNNLDIEWIAQSRWCYRKTFWTPDNLDGKNLSLCFDGVDYSCSVYFNGEKLSDHEGMFGGPYCDISGKMKPGCENTLIVMVQPAPLEEPYERFSMSNIYKHLKASVAYGWHYVKLISIGIWNPVYITINEAISFDQNTFVSTDMIRENGVMTSFAIFLDNRLGVPADASLELSICPKNFAGDSFQTKLPISIPPGKSKQLFTRYLDNIKLWWPKKFSAPNLYDLQVRLVRHDERLDEYTSSIGFRTIEMVPCNFGAREIVYNWQFEINNEKHWITGTNWCSPDPLLRCNKDRYKRFIELAINGNFDILRVWGGGPIEADSFYDEGDEKGIMVWQEFPLYGLSLADEIPVELCKETARVNARQLRNRPSLAVWCGSNEVFYSWFEKYNQNGRSNTLLGRTVMEYDGTRSYRTTCLYGGDTHWYGVYWGDQPITDYQASIEDIRVGQAPGISGIKDGPVAYTEWGLASPANLATWQRIMPRTVYGWPLKREGMFVHHTPAFNDIHIDEMTRYGQDSIPICQFVDLIFGSQIAQGCGYRYVIEQMRAKKPYTTATFIYKLTENYPSCSWAVLDYYAVPNISYYMAMQSQALVVPLVLFDRWNVGEEGINFKLLAVNDSVKSIQNARCVLKILDADLRLFDTKEYKITIPTDQSLLIDTFTSNKRSLDDIFFIVADLMDGESFVSRSWYYFNHVGRSERLCDRKRAELTAFLVKNGSGFVLSCKNTGLVPVLGLYIDLGDASFSYYVDKNYIYIGAGRKVKYVSKKLKPLMARFSALKV